LVVQSISTFQWRRTKLQPSGERGILVGYNEDLKAYKVFLTEQRRTMVSRDVKFEENLASRKYQDLPIVVEGLQEVELKDEPRVETSSVGSQTPKEVEEQSAPST
jgi:hypothetical protein